MLTTSRLSGRFGPAASLAALWTLMLGSLLGVGTAWATTTISPQSAVAGQATSFTVRVVDAGVDLVSSVVAEFPADFGFAGCGAPQGWDCSGGEGSTIWQRASSITPEDTFSFTLVAPEQTGDVTFTLVDNRASGASSSTTATVSIVEPEPDPDAEPTETEEPSEEPTEEPSPPSTDEPSRPAPPLEPFRPPAEDGPISIRDLPDEPASTETEVEVAAPASSGGGRNLRMLVLAPLALLLLLSASGFVLAESNR